MITEDLVAYIQAQIRKNTPRDLIAIRLRNAGWHETDIEEGLRKVMPPTNVLPSEKVKYIPKNVPIIDEVKGPDQYRELLEVNVIKETAKIKSEPTVAASNLAPSPVEIEAPQVIQTQVVPPVTATPTPEIQTEAPKIVRRPEPVMYVIPGTDVSPTPPKVIEEFTPTLMPKAEPEPVFTSIQPQAPVATINNLPRSAIISSYADDLTMANATNTIEKEQKSKKPVKWLLITLGICIVLGATLALASGFMPFIKKDPKMLLLSAPVSFGTLNSYKSKTNAILSTPSFANITAGLVSGEAVMSPDRDSISIHTEAEINQHNGESTSSVYRATFKSSIWQEDILTDIFYDGKSSFINMPNLSQILGDNAPPAQTISINKNRFGVLTSLLPTYLNSKIKMIDLDKMLLKGIDPYTNTDTGSAFKEFVSTADVIEKSPEDINGAPTYHYQINADKQATKKLLSSLASYFLMNLSDEVKKSVEEDLATATLDSFEVWIGKNDNNIYQYKFIFSIPLSRVIGLDDKGIAGNKVTLDWTSTFYDFNTKNKITMPKESIPVENYMKQIDDMKIVDTVSPLSSITSNLYNAEGSFGKNSNPTGSCTDPAPGSLFSPIGHGKGSVVAVGNIAGVMNKVLNTTEDIGACYSTSNAWAVSFPLSSNPNSYYCIDNLNAGRVTNVPLTGTVCK